MVEIYLPAEDQNIGANMAKRIRPPQKICIEGASYPGLNLNKFKLGDEVEFTMKGQVCSMSDSYNPSGYVDLTVLVKEMREMSSQKEGMETARRELHGS